MYNWNIVLKVVEFVCHFYIQFPQHHIKFYMNFRCMNPHFGERINYHVTLLINMKKINISEQPCITWDVFKEWLENDVF